MPEVNSKYVITATKLDRHRCTTCLTPKAAAYADGQHNYYCGQCFEQLFGEMHALLRQTVQLHPRWEALWKTLRKLNGVQQNSQD